MLLALGPFTNYSFVASLFHWYLLQSMRCSVFRVACWPHFRIQAILGSLHQGMADDDPSNGHRSSVQTANKNKVDDTESLNQFIRGAMCNHVV